MKQKHKVAVILPAFNEEKRLKQVLTDFKRFKFPLIVVDDGSKDRTSKIAKNYADIFLKHQVNLGKGAALKTGCEYAFTHGFSAVVLIDADGQHASGDLPGLVEVLQSSPYQIIFGSRQIKDGVPFVRSWGNRLASLFIYLLFGIYLADLICGYRALTKKAYQKIVWNSKGYGVETEMVIRVGQQKIKYCQFPVQTIYHDKFKGVTILTSINIMLNVLRWRLSL